MPATLLTSSSPHCGTGPYTGRHVQGGAGQEHLLGAGRVPYTTVRVPPTHLEYTTASSYPGIASQDPSL